MSSAGDDIVIMPMGRSAPVAVFAKATSPFEIYEQGPHKGRNKLTVALLKSTPIASQFMKDSKSSLDFLNNSAGGF